MLSENTHADNHSICISCPKLGMCSYLWREQNFDNGKKCHLQEDNTPPLKLHVPAHHQFEMPNKNRLYNKDLLAIKKWWQIKFLASIH